MEDTQEEQIKDLKKILKEKEQKVKFLTESSNEKSKQFDAERLKLHNKLEDLQQREHKIKSLHHEKELIAEAHKQLDLKFSSASIENEELKVAQNILNQKVAHLHYQLKNREKELSGMKLKLDSSSAEFEEKVKQKEKITDGLRMIISQTNAELQKTKAAERKILNERDLLQNDLKQSESQGNRLKDEIGNLKMEKKNLQKVSWVKLQLDSSSAELEEKLKQNGEIMNGLCMII